MKKLLLVLLVAMTFMSTTEVKAQDSFLGEVKIFAGNFAPRDWAPCDGRLIPISQNAALFSLLGTTYGGDGRTTFALPDLRGRVPIGQGRGEGLTPHTIGQRGGTEIINSNPHTIKNGDGVESTVNQFPQQIQNSQPYLTVNYIICINGIYPSRS